MTKKQRIERERRRQLKRLAASATPEQRRKMQRSRREGRRLRQRLEQMEQRATCQNGPVHIGQILPGLMEDIDQRRELRRLEAEDLQ